MTSNEPDEPLVDEAAGTVPRAGAISTSLDTGC
jgi:hypothetical protein